MITVNTPNGSRKFSTERVTDLLSAAIEGGIGHWAAIVDRSPRGEWWNTYNATAEGTGSITVHEVNIDGVPDKTLAPHVLDQAAIVKGLEMMAEKFPKHFDDFADENEDADTGDVFMQLAVLGEIVYA